MKIIAIRDQYKEIIQWLLKIKIYESLPSLCQTIFTFFTVFQVIAAFPSKVPVDPTHDVNIVSPSSSTIVISYKSSLLHCKVSSDLLRQSKFLLPLFDLHTPTKSSVVYNVAIKWK